jgi:amidase
MSADIAALFNERDSLEIAALVKAGEVHPSELAEEAIRRIEALNPTLNAVSMPVFDYGRKAAADPALPDGPFKGVPFLLKDLGTLWEGIPLANSCAYLKDFVCPVDMTYTRRIKAAGFVLLGRSNAPEFGWCLATEPKLFGRTNNPWNLDVTPGGSSGGAAAALASRMVPFVDASDGAGSTRVPASHTGLVGMKPARGRVTLDPFPDYWYGGASFLTVTHTVRETAAYLDAVGGRVLGDVYYTDMPATPYLDEVGKDPGNLRIGVTLESPDGKPIHPEVLQAVRDAAALCESLGHTVEERTLDLDWERFWTTYTDMTSAQTASGFEDFEPIVGRAVTEADVAPLIWGIIQKGKAIDGPQHYRDVNALKEMSRELIVSLNDCDVHIMPVLGHPARPHGYYDMTISDPDRYNAELMGPDAVFAAPFNASGLPAVSLPLHWTADGLPVGVQFVGRERDEQTLFRLAGQLEQAKPWKERRPPVLAT